MRPENLVNDKIAEGLNEVFDSTERDDLEAYGEPRGTQEIMPEDSEERRLVRNRIPEVTIVRKINQIPDVVSEIEDISKWFPKLGPKLPYVQISISSSLHEHPMYDSQNGIDIPPESSIHDKPFPLEYHIIEYDDEDITDTLDIPDGLKTITTNNFDIEWMLDDFLSDIYDEITEPSTDELLNFYATQYYTEAWEDAIFHFDQVLRAYRHNQIGVLIVLVSVFFESKLFSKLDSHMEEIKENPHAGSLLNDSMKFEKILDYCRYFDLIDETEFGLLMKMKSARNNYAHDIDAFRHTKETNLESEDKVDDLIELYESYVGVESSMVKEEH